MAWKARTTTCIWLLPNYSKKGRHFAGPSLLFGYEEDTQHTDAHTDQLAGGEALFKKDKADHEQHTRKPHICNQRAHADLPPCAVYKQIPQLQCDNRKPQCKACPVDLMNLLQQIFISSHQEKQNQRADRSRQIGNGKGSQRLHGKRG